MAIKILATSDLHLGKKSSEVPRTANESSTRFTWDRLVDWSVRHNVDVVLLAGDIIDQDNRYFEAVGALQSGFDRLNREGIKVFIVTGNHDHDVLPAMVNESRYENIYLLGENGKWEVSSYRKDNLTVQFTGWSFPEKFVQESPLMNFTGEGLNRNLFTIGLFHGDAYSRESRYGPFDINNLLNKYVDTWIIGHIHKPARLKENDPIIWYPGSPHALSPKETGQHGPLLLTIESRHVAEVKQVPLSPVRYETLNIDITGAKDESEVRDRVTSMIYKESEDLITELEKVMYLIYDIHLTGSHARVHDLKSWTLSLTDYRREMESGTIIIPRKVVNNATPETENLKELALQPTPAGIMAKTILTIQNGGNSEFLDTLKAKWFEEREKLKTSGTYQPLTGTAAPGEGGDENPIPYILRECNRLLSEFIKQQAN